MKKNRNTVLITGGAGFIGAAVSEEMARLNSDLILVDINKKNLDALKKKLCSKYDCKVDIFNCDMSNTNELSSLVSQISKKYKRIDTIINSVGMVGTDKMKGWNTGFDNQGIEAWQKCLDINLSSIFFLIQKLYKKMQKSDNASIVNISSIYGISAPDWELYKGTNINNPGAYSVSKAGVVHMTRWLASTLSPKIRVNCVSPGGVYRNQSEKFVKKYKSRTLLNRMATEKDIVGPVVFLSSSSASYITGENVIVDGGWTIK
tara:strand:+ start:16782 stop:17564 length:783 start_codon:yes stop_codon:yes gene_type:complete